MEYEYGLGDRFYKVSLNSKDGKTVASIEDEEYEVDIHTVSENRISLIINEQSFNVYITEEEGKCHIHIGGNAYCFSKPGAEDGCNTIHKSGTGEARLSITAPMPGNVLKINVSEGEEVEEGQCLAIVEAMKMETGLHSTITGKVKKINAVEGQQVNAGDSIIDLEDI